MFRQERIALGSNITIDIKLLYFNESSQWHVYTVQKIISVYVYQLFHKSKFTFNNLKMFLMRSSMFVFAKSL